MQEDNMYKRPTSAFIPTEPAEQQAERDNEDFDVLSHIDLIQSIVARFKDRMNFYCSPEAIDTDLLTDPAKHMHQTLGIKAAYDAVKFEHDALVELLKDFKKEDSTQ